MVLLQVLIDGFAISALYALGATGFTLIFGVSGVLNLSHGSLMVAAAVAAWFANAVLGTGPYLGALFGVATGVVLALLTYGIVVRPIQRSRLIRTEEREIFILTATLLWGIMIQELIAYFFTDNAKTVLPIVGRGGRRSSGVRTPQSTRSSPRSMCWAAIGHAVAPRQQDPNRQGGDGRLDEPARRHPARHRAVLASTSIVWAIYGVLAGHRRRAAGHVPRRLAPTAPGRSPAARSRSWCWAALAASPAR